MKLIIAALALIAGSVAHAEDTKIFDCTNKNTTDSREPQSLELTVTDYGSMAIFHTANQMQGAYDFATSTASGPNGIVLEGVPGPTPSSGVYVLNKSIVLSASGKSLNVVATSADGHASTFVCTTK